MFFLDFPDYQETFFINGYCCYFNKIRIISKRLDLDKIDAMLFQIAYALFVVAPEPEDLHHSLVFKHLVDQTVLNIDAA
mgnify:CR=1 FL=1